MYFLYLYTDQTNSKKYIGITNNLKQRKKAHTRGYSGAGLFSRAVKKYGIENFNFCVLAILDNVDEAARTEQAAILAFNTLFPNGYNLKAGAPGTLYNGSPTEETRRKMSISNKGKKRSTETCIKISNAQKYRLQSEEARKKQADSHRGQIAWNKGISCSEETRVKISVAKKGKKCSQETCAKRSEISKGRIHSPEIRIKISEAHRSSQKSKEHLAKVWVSNTGKKRSVETCQKISETKKKQFIAKRAAAEETTNVTE